MLREEEVLEVHTNHCTGVNADSGCAVVEQALSQELDVHSNRHLYRQLEVQPAEVELELVVARERDVEHVLDIGKRRAPLCQPNASMALDGRAELAKIGQLRDVVDRET